MYKVRALFHKGGTAKYISHLDLMQVFRRAFSRMGLRLTYSGGFHPHMQMNILLPLSTGFSSECEILELELDATHLPDNFLYQLNRALPEGITVTTLIDSERPPKFIGAAQYEIYTELPATVEAVKELFSREELIVNKRTKRGHSDTNIIPLVKSFVAESKNEGMLLTVTVSQGNESLNPEYIITAIEKYLELSPAYTTYHRKEVFDTEGRIFR